MINNLGDIPVHEFRKRGHELIDWIADYLATNENYPVLSQVKPGEIKEKLPKHPPEDAESFLNIYDDVNNIIMPGITHWNHPGFMAYFNSTGLRRSSVCRRPARWRRRERGEHCDSADRFRNRTAQRTGCCAWQTASSKC